MTDQTPTLSLAERLFPNQGKDSSPSSSFGQGTAEAQLAQAVGEGKSLDTSTPAADPASLPANSLDPSFLAADTAKALGVELTDEFKSNIAAFHPVAAELKLTGEQVAKLSAWRDAQNTAYWEKQSQADIEAVKAIPDYQVHVDAARAALKSYGDEEVMAWLDESGVGNSPHLIRVLSKMQASLTELRGQLNRALTPSLFPKRR